MKRARDALPPFGYAYTTATIKGARAMMTPRERVMERACFAHWHAEFRRMGVQPGVDAPSIAYTVHCLVDERMQVMRETSKHGPDIKCKRGCAACCHLSVDVSPQEAILLRVIAKDQGIPIDEARLDRQASKSFDTWHELPVEDRRCVFLGEDNACRVYEHRPGACRKYTVKSDPERCDMDKYPGGEVAIVFDVEAEIIQSAAMTVFGARSMAEQLIATREGPA